MMFKFAIAAAALIGMAGAAHAQTSEEIGYAPGTLGFQAMMQGEYENALIQLQLSEATLAEDPAHMINMGSAYARLGRNEAAEQMYRAALQSDLSFDIVLANGEVMSTRDAARRALSDLRSEVAAR